MTTKLDLEKQLEANLGYPLDEDALKTIPLILSVAVSTLSTGSTTRRHLIAALPNICQPNLVLDVSGVARTGSNGQSLFRLDQFICPTNEAFFRPINVVATPLSSTPFFLTVGHSLINNGADVEIKVLAWDASGVAAPNVSFNWQCRVALQPGNTGKA